MEDMSRTIKKFLDNLIDAGNKKSKRFTYDDYDMIGAVFTIVDEQLQRHTIGIYKNDDYTKDLKMYIFSVSIKASYTYGYHFHSTFTSMNELKSLVKIVISELQQEANTDSANSNKVNLYQEYIAMFEAVL